MFRLPLRRRLRDIELFSRVLRRKPVFKPHHILARLLWARTHVNRTTEQWIRVIWWVNALLFWVENLEEDDAFEGKVMHI